ncbi:hypothetical protein FT888_11260 [Clostridium perfringens]|nr:hypothetical protein [Clostridium perfringens]
MNNKKIALVFFICAILLYVASAITFLNESSDKSMFVVFLCAGSSFLTLGGVFSNKNKKENENNLQSK